MMLPEFCVAENRERLSDVFELLLMLGLLLLACVGVLVRVVLHLDHIS